MQIGELTQTPLTQSGAPVNLQQLGESKAELKFGNLPDPALPEK